MTKWICQTQISSKSTPIRNHLNWVTLTELDEIASFVDGRFKINPVELTIDPREEWKQMFGEVSRRYRESFYDPNLHGQNLAQLQAHYAAYLPNINTREDLNKLLNEMLSHLSTSHLIVSGGDVTVPQGGFVETVGLLGADLEIDRGRYRIKRILRGDNTRQIFSPLALPGVNVKVGEYILAVDGTWLMENRGVTPDYELEIMPPAWRAGRDPQLEKAVELAMDALKKTKPLPNKRPTYPIYK